MHPQQISLLQSPETMVLYFYSALYLSLYGQILYFLIQWGKMRKITLFPFAPVSQKALCTATVLLYFLFFLPVIARADESSGKLEMPSLLEKGLEELVEVDVSIATGTPKPLKLAPAVATVITAEDIEDMGATTLDEALETVPGLHVVPSNLNRLNSSYSIRGILTKENPQVLLLIDGHPIRYATKGNRPDTFNMSTSNISRIEIIRGPGSALYGADAFAGTINVITKKASEINGAVFGMRAGSFGTTDTWLQYGGSYHGWDIALSLDYLRSDGDKDRIIDADLQTTLDAALGTHASKAPGPLETRDRIPDAHLSITKNNWDLRMWYWEQRDGGEGAGAAQALDPTGREKNKLFLTDLTYNNNDIAPDWDMALRLNYKYIKEDNYLVLFPPGAALPIGADGNIDFVHPTIITQFPDGVIGRPGATENHTGIDLTAAYRGCAKHLLRFGAGFNYATVDPFESKNFGPGVLDGTQSVQDGTLTDVTGTQYVFLKDVDRSILYALVQDEWTLMKNVELTAGVRYDHYSDFGGNHQPQIGAGMANVSRTDNQASLREGLPSPLFCRQLLPE
jgi:outer membrane receptor for ferrienterochelin and colicins